MFVVRWVARHKAAVLLTLLLVALAPLPVAALTNSEVIALYKESIQGLLALTRLAYCAAGVAPLC